METTNALTTSNGLTFLFNVADDDAYVHLGMKAPTNGTATGWLTPSEAMDLAARLREYADLAMRDRPAPFSTHNESRAERTF